MGVISTKAQSVDRQSLTFKMLGTGSTGFVNASKKLAAETIDESDLVLQQDVADKMGFLMKMISVLKAELLCKMVRYEVICHARSFTGYWSATNGVDTTIPFTTLVYTPTDGSFTLGVFTAGRSGYYDVDAFLWNEDLINPPGARVWMRISGSLDVYDCDSVEINTNRFYLQGSRKVWCDEGGQISAALRHDQVIPLPIHTLAYPGADGYISISYAASQNAATY